MTDREWPNPLNWRVVALIPVAWLLVIAVVVGVAVVLS